MNRAEWLGKRITELHAIGKKPVPGGLTLGEQIQFSADNLKSQKYPGVLARRQAELEYGDLSLPTPASMQEEFAQRVTRLSQHMPEERARQMARDYMIREQKIRQP